LQLTQKKQQLQFKTLDSILQTINAETREKQVGGQSHLILLRVAGFDVNHTKWAMWAQLTGLGPNVASITLILRLIAWRSPPL
jgi:hypothetical protein